MAPAREAVTRADQARSVAAQIRVRVRAAPENPHSHPRKYCTPVFSPSLSKWTASQHLLFSVYIRSTVVLRAALWLWPLSVARAQRGAWRNRWSPCGHAAAAHIVPRAVRRARSNSCPHFACTLAHVASARVFLPARLPACARDVVCARRSSVPGHPFAPRGRAYPLRPPHESLRMYPCISTPDPPALDARASVNLRLQLDSPRYRGAYTLARSWLAHSPAAHGSAAIGCRVVGCVG